MAPEQDKHYLRAHKNVQRGRHQLILDLAKMGTKKPDIVAILDLVDWKTETEWLAQEYRDKEEAEKTPAPKPVVIPPPPSDAPQVQ